MRHFLLPAICIGFSTTFLAPVFSPAKNNDFDFGTAGDVRITGIDPKTGTRSFSVMFKEASPAPAQPGVEARNAVMLLKNVAIKSYAEGKSFLELTTPECLYDKDTKTASGNSPITATAELFELTGEDWAWETQPDADIIRISKNVRVTMKSANPRQAPVYVVSGRLDARIPKNRAAGEQTQFVFSENVRVQMIAQTKGGARNDVSLTSDRITVRANADARRLESFSPEKTQSAGGNKNENALHSLDTVVASGNAHITSQGREIFGDNATYTQATGTFAVQDNARFEERKQRVTVTGDRITHKLSSDEVEVTGIERRPVLLTVPSFAQAKNTRRKADVDSLASVTGSKLIVAMTDEKNRIDFQGNAHVRDEGFELFAEKIFVETPHDKSLFAADIDGLAGVDRIVAEQKIRASYAGTNLSCEHAEIKPRQNVIELAGAPTAENKKSAAALSGYAMTINTKEHNIRVSSEPQGDSPVRQRVVVTLPPLKSAAEQRRENVAAPLTKTTVTSDNLVMSEDEINDSAYFNFQGNVVLAGAGISGTCDKLDVVADSKKSSARNRQAADGPDASQIRRITADGNVRLATDKCLVEGGRAEIFPRAVLKENTVEADNGMDGREPQFITLRSDPANPGNRPRITLYGAALPGIAGINGTAGTTSGDGKITVESNYQELFNGSERARFFLRDNVVITGKDLHGTCDTVEGETLRPLKKDQSAGTEITRIIGRGNVRFDVQRNIATGSRVEMLPQEKKIHLTGKPTVTTEGGVVADPGNRITYDWATRNWRMEGDPPSATPVQIQRPTIVIPLRSKNFRR